MAGRPALTALFALFWLASAPDRASAAPGGTPGPPAATAKATLTVTADTQLRFGDFVVPIRGARTIAPGGLVTDSGVFTVRTGTTGPAQFTVTYDQNSNSPQPYAVTFELVLGAVSPVRLGGITGTLSNFTSDLAGFPVLTPGQPVRIVLDNCLRRTCSKSFRVGARLDVARASGGGAIVIPIPVGATLIEVRKL